MGPEAWGSWESPVTWKGVYTMHDTQRIKTTHASRDPICIRLVCNRAGMKENEASRRTLPIDMQYDLYSIPFCPPYVISTPPAICIPGRRPLYSRSTTVQHHAQPPPAGPSVKGKTGPSIVSVLTPANSLTRSRVGKSTPYPIHPGKGKRG
jgi:hypothetical protein